MIFIFFALIVLHQLFLSRKSIGKATAWVAGFHLTDSESERGHNLVVEGANRKGLDCRNFVLESHPSLQRLRSSLLDSLLPVHISMTRALMFHFALIGLVLYQERGHDSTYTSIFYDFSLYWGLLWTLFGVGFCKRLYGQQQVERLECLYNLFLFAVSSGLSQQNAFIPEKVRLQVLDAQKKGEPYSFFVRDAATRALQSECRRIEQFERKLKSSLPLLELAYFFPVLLAGASVLLEISHSH